MSEKRVRTICFWFAMGGILSMALDTKAGSAIGLTALSIALISLWTEPQP